MNILTACLILSLCLGGTLKQLINEDIKNANDSEGVLPTSVNLANDFLQLNLCESSEFYPLHTAAPSPGFVVAQAKLVRFLNTGQPVVVQKCLE